MIATSEVPCPWLRRPGLLGLALFGLLGCSDAPGVDGVASGAAVSGESDVPGARSDRDRAARTPAIGSDAVDPVSIPAGTLVRARLDAGVSSRSHGEGDRFVATVVDEVLATDGMVLIPEGARVHGSIRLSWLDTGVDAEAFVLGFDHLVIGGDRLDLDAELLGTEFDGAGHLPESGAGALQTGAPVRGDGTGPEGSVVEPKDSTEATGGREAFTRIGAGSILMLRLESPIVLDSY